MAAAVARGRFRAASGAVRSLRAGAGSVRGVRLREAMKKRHGDTEPRRLRRFAGGASRRGRMRPREK